MNEIVACLFAWLTVVTGAEPPATFPTIVKMPHTQLEQISCGVPCPILGVYKDGDAVYLDERLQPEKRLFDRSILLHELVHYLQRTSGKYEGIDREHADPVREREAYGLQHVFLHFHGQLPPGRAPVGPGCPAASYAP